jgi:hypothetical protein
MKILWLDDDAPAHSFNIGPVSIRTAGTCAEASEILLSGEIPEWIIVDLIVPQGNWGNSELKLPGLAFIEFISKEYKDKIQLAVFSIVMPPGMERRLQTAGAAKCYAKSNTSLIRVIEDLRRNDAEKSFSRQTNVGNDQPGPYGLPLQDEVSRVIQGLLERIYLSTEVVSEQEIAELHKAKLAIENDQEKRLRSYQTLKALNDSAGTPASNTSYAGSGDLEQLRRTIELIISHKRLHGIFDVFLSYNSADADEVELLAVALKSNGILPWFDRWEIRPGSRWQKELAKQIQTIKSAAVMIGKSGIGPWHEQEIEAFLIEFARRECPVIPVLLPSAVETPELPVFLRGAHLVDFRRTGRDSLQRLLWAIIG